MADLESGASRRKFAVRIQRLQKIGPGRTESGILIRSEPAGSGDAIVVIGSDYCSPPAC